MVGSKVGGSVNYTSVRAMAHDYTVVIPARRAIRLSSATGDNQIALR
jgi:hypothetical protein